MNGITGFLPTNKMRDKQLDSSTQEKDGDRQPEDFGPPDVTSLASLTDGRVPGDFTTRYSVSAWIRFVQNCHTYC